MIWGFGISENVGDRVRWDGVDTERADVCNGTLNLKGAELNRDLWHFLVLKPCEHEVGMRGINLGGLHIVLTGPLWGYIHHWQLL